MKIIHCADLHLDSPFSSGLPEEKARERRAELLGAFSAMVDFAAENGVRAIIIAGDLYDTRAVSPTARNLVRDAVRNNPGIRFFYLRGNHDASAPLLGAEALPNLCLFGADWTSYDLGGVTVTGAERGSAPLPPPSLDSGKFNIVVLHGQESETGGEVELRPLRGRGIDYLALGHIHSFKAAKLDARGRYCYPGCLVGRGFDECGEHGFVLLDIDEESGTCADSFVPTAERRLCLVRADVSDCMTTSDAERTLRRWLGEEGCSADCLVKAVLVGETHPESERDLELLKKRFEGDFYYFRIADETTVGADFDALAMDASLKGEFIRAVMAENGMTDAERAAVARCGLRALAGEAI